MATDIVRADAAERCMDYWASTRLVAWATGKDDQKTKESLRAEINAFAADLAGANPSPVERVLSETAALSWFALRMAEAHYAGAANSERGLTIAQSDYHQRRIDRAHRRLLATLKTLATVRRLGVPAVQINLARNQVNVAGSPPTDSDFELD